MERSRITFCISILLISSKLALADHPSVGLTTGGAAPITTTGAGTLNKGKWSVGFQYEYIDNNSISDNRLIENAEANEDSDVHSISTVRQYSVNIATCITDNFTLAALFPYIERTNIKEAHHDKHLHLKWDLILEINGEWREKEDIDGKTNDDCGGLLMYLSPGLRVASNNGLSALLAVGVPLVEDLNGLQSKPQYRIIANPSFAF